MTSLEYYIEQVEQFISALTDDIESGEGTVVTQTKLAVYQEVLEHLEEIEQEPCEDAISRQAALDTEYQIKETNGIEYVMLSEVQMKIRKLPPINPTKTAHWKHNKCDVCGASRPPLFDNYCPNCGAKMIVLQERSGEE